jgi:hypothetical protein
MVHVLKLSAVLLVGQFPFYGSLGSNVMLLYLWVT